MIDKAHTMQYFKFNLKHSLYQRHDTTKEQNLKDERNTILQK